MVSSVLSMFSSDQPADRETAVGARQMGGAMTRQSVNQYVYDVAVVGLGPVGEFGGTAVGAGGPACARA